MNDDDDHLGQGGNDEKKGIELMYFVIGAIVTFIIGCICSFS